MTPKSRPKNSTLAPVLRGEGWGEGRMGSCCFRGPARWSRPRLRVQRGGPAARRALAAVELALLLPMLVFVFVVAVDWARIFHYSLMLTNAARQGAVYGANLNATATSPYTGVQQAALAEVSGLSPQPTVTSATGSDASGNPYIDVTVAWQFSTMTSFPGVPSPVNLTRKVRMRVAPLVPY